MEFFINDPNTLRYPPSETRLLDLRASPDSEGKRLRVDLELSPFQQRPDIDITLKDSAGNEIASASIIEPVSWKLELNLHIRRTTLLAGKYTLAARLYYPELGEVDQRTLSIDIPHSGQTK
jgi:hypothetical protein